MVRIRLGKQQFGCEIATEQGYLINRTAGTSLFGEPLMCDVCNTTYDTDADEGGNYGNGLTPALDATWTFNHLLVPMAIVKEAGVAVGSRVAVAFEARRIKALVNAAGAAARLATDFNATNRYLSTRAGAKTLAIRCTGYTLEAHGGTGTETRTVFFDGLHNLG